MERKDQQLGIRKRAKFSAQDANDAREPYAGNKEVPSSAQQMPKATPQTSNRRALRRATFVHKPASSVSLVTSSNVDAFLASVGLATSLALLQVMEDSLFPFKVNASFLISSAVKFFFNRNPPDLTTICYSSLFAIFAGSLLHFWRDAFGKWATYVLLFILMYYWKLTGNMWSAASSLAIYVTNGSGNWGQAESIASLLKQYPFMYIMSPYILGHLLLYVLALLWSILRSQTRVILIKREFFLVEGAYLASLPPAQQQQRLRDLFHRMDLSGDGRLDAEEFQAAIRSEFGEEIDIRDARMILKSVDTDGDGTVNFDEFSHAVDKIIRL